MLKNTVHMIIVSAQFAERNFEWLRRFTFHKENTSMYFFSCSDVQDAVGGMVKFCDVPMKTNESTEDILLPYHAIEGVLLDQDRKNQLGFAAQE